MDENHSNKQSETPLARQNENHDRIQARDPNVYRGHLPPPFYNAKDEDLSGRQYPSEARSSQHMAEDIGNYGRGGYYGLTYDQENINRTRRISADNPAGYRDSYRHLGDRRWSGAGENSWEQERQSRPGYSSTQERIDLAGIHRGKGPRSYRRSDNRILEDVNDRLCDDPFLDASEIEIEVRDGEIILSGMVESRQAKRRAEDIAESVSGVRQIENRLRITPRSE